MSALEDLAAHVDQGPRGTDRDRPEADRGRSPRLRPAARGAGLRRRRIAALAAGLPIETAGVTINRNCASSLQAINDAAMSVAARCDDVQIAGGVGSIGTCAHEQGLQSLSWHSQAHRRGVMQMGLTAEYLAVKYPDPSRRVQDEFALRSHQLAAAATDRGEFKAEVVPTWGRDDSGRKVLLDGRPVHPPRDLDGSPGRGFLLRSTPRGSRHRGDSSPINVGAAALLVMSEEKSRELRPETDRQVRAMAAVGVDPAEMGIGPVPAVKKALARAGLKLTDIDCIELNEAFAVQVLSCLKLSGN